MSIAAPRRRFGFVAAVVALLTAIGILVAIFLSVDRPNSPRIGDTSDGNFPTVDSGATTATFDQMSQFVRSYYGLLPSDTDAAWSKLGTDYQSTAGGRASFDSFWSSMSAVDVGSVGQRDASSVTVALTYSFPNGSTSSETRWVQVGVDDGTLYIENSGL
jgi:eukaryotic-like serine/threonine-protein kinase